MIPAFLLKNPLASGMGVLALVAAIGCGVQSLRLAWSQNDVWEEKLGFERFQTNLAKETLRLEREAKSKSDTKIDELADEMRTVGIVATQAKTEIRLVQSNGGPCDRDPAYLAGVNGVRRILEAPAGGGGGAGPPRR